MRDTEKRKEYCDKVSNELKSIRKTTNQEYWSNICKICVTTSEKLKEKEKKHKHTFNSEIEIYSEHRKILRLQIEKCQDPDKRKALKNTEIK